MEKSFKKIAYACPTAKKGPKNFFACFRKGSQRGTNKIYVKTRHNHPVTKNVFIFSESSEKSHQACSRHYNRAVHYGESFKKSCICMSDGEKGPKTFSLISEKCPRRQNKRDSHTFKNLISYTHSFSHTVPAP